MNPIWQANRPISGIPGMGAFVKDDISDLIMNTEPAFYDQSHHQPDRTRK